MSNTEKKKVNWLRVVRPVAIALTLIILLSYGTYAWLKRDWSPEILQSDMRIIAGSGLTFQFKDIKDDVPIESEKINELLKLDTIELKSVSSCTGKSEDFFALEYGLTETDDVLKKLDPEKDLDAEELANLKNEEFKYTLLGKKYGYVDLTFTVSSNNISKQKVYLRDSSKIKLKDGVEVGAYNPLYAMRVSITVDGGEPLVFLPSLDGSTPVRENHTGITNKDDDGKGYTADGISPTYAQTVSTDAKIFNSFFEGKTALFTIAPGEYKTVTVCIWLEGVDEDCKDDIAGSALDLLIEFTAASVKNETETVSE